MTKSRDLELSRLGDKRDNLKQRMNSAFDRQKDLWDQAKQLGAEQSRLYDMQKAAGDQFKAFADQLSSGKSDRDSAYSEQRQAWDSFQAANDEYYNYKTSVSSTIDRNNSEIASLKREADDEAQAMRDCFNNAASAYDDHDGESAKEYSNEGHEHQDRLAELNSQVHALINENKEIFAQLADLRERKDNAKAESERARETLRSIKITPSERSQKEQLRREAEVAHSTWKKAKTHYDQAKADARAATAEWKRLRADYKQAQADFQKRLNELKAQNQKKRESDQEIARQAGVPTEYLNDILVKRESDGSINIYFGGIGKPDGEGHGHIAVDPSGNPTYDRHPYAPHGAQNFKDYKERRKAKERQEREAHLDTLPSPDDPNVDKWYARSSDDANKDIEYGEFDGQPAKVKFGENGDSTRMDIFYGDPYSSKHGHAVTKNNSVNYWRRPNENSNNPTYDYGSKKTKKEAPHANDGVDNI